MTLNRAASLTIVLIGLIFGMVVAKDFLIPIVIAVCLWYVTVSISRVIGRLKLGKWSPSPAICTILAAIVIIAFVFVSIEIVVQSVESMVEAAPSYQARFEDLLARMLVAFNLERMPSSAQILEKVDFRPLISELGVNLSGFAGNTFLVIIYTIFLLLEQGMLPRKWRASFTSKDHFIHANRTMERISNSVREYISVKAGMSFLTAAASWVVMVAVGLDFAVFWAFLIFLLNFVPNIGSLLATTFPVLLALLQFDTLTEMFILLVGIATVQFSVANFLEPRLLGRALNISSLVVLISLSLWGAIWGVIGMVLSVPLTVTIMIILAEFPETKPIAIWLSADGDVSEKEK